MKSHNEIVQENWCHRKQIISKGNLMGKTVLQKAFKNIIRKSYETITQQTATKSKEKNNLSTAFNNMKSHNGSQSHEVSSENYAAKRA